MHNSHVHFTFSSAENGVEGHRILPVLTMRRFLVFKRSFMNLTKDRLKKLNTDSSSICPHLGAIQFCTRIGVILQIIVYKTMRSFHSHLPKVAY